MKMELFICRLKLDNVEGSFRLQRGKEWKKFPEQQQKKIQTFEAGREGRQ